MWATTCACLQPSPGAAARPSSRWASLCRACDLPNSIAGHGFTFQGHLDAALPRGAAVAGSTGPEGCAEHTGCLTHASLPSASCARTSPCSCKHYIHLLISGASQESPSAKSDPMQGLSPPTAYRGQLLTQAACAGPRGCCSARRASCCGAWLAPRTCPTSPTLWWTRCVGEASTECTCAEHLRSPAASCPARQCDC